MASCRIWKEWCHTNHSPVVFSSTAMSLRRIHLHLPPRRNVSNTYAGTQLPAEYKNCLYICANIFIALSQIKRGNKFYGGNTFWTFPRPIPISRVRIVQHSYSHYFPFQLLLQLTGPSLFAILWIYHTFGRDGKGRASVMGLWRWHPFFLVEPTIARFDFGSRRAANLKLANSPGGPFNWRPGMWSHIQAINFGYYYYPKKSFSK